MNYPKYPLLIERVQYKNYSDAGLYLTRFQHDNIPVLFIGNSIEETVYVICNINPDDNYDLNDFEFAIKDYSENEGMLNWLIKNQYVEEPDNFYKSGYVTIFICKASKKIKDFMTENCQ